MIQKIKVPADVALLITRFIIGGIFIYTGWLKVSDMAMTISFFNSLHIPVFLTYIVSYGELIGGVMLVLGLWTELAALFLAVVMAVAVYLTRTMGFQSFGTPLVVLSSLIAILGCGAGRFKVK